MLDGTSYLVPKVLLSCKGVGCTNSFATYATQNKKYCSSKCRYSNKTVYNLLEDTVKYRHVLSEISAVHKTATCSVCGPIDIRKRTEKKKFSEHVGWRCRGAERAREWAYKYGISPEAVYSLLSEQDGLCRICPKDIRANFNVDHCHVTDKVRGLLCNNCNTGIGLLRDSPDILREAAKYIEEYCNH